MAAVAAAGLPGTVRFDNRIDTSGADGEMGEKDDESDGKPGFKINLPFGMGWLRGDGGHVSQLMPAIRWIVVVASAWWILRQVLLEWGS